MPTPRKCCEPETSPGGACACPDAMLAPEDVPAERGRYFTGKYMTARDLTAEQAYFVSRHRLHQRALHGWGLVCGLDIVAHPTQACADEGWVIVTPGIAIDCYGRELVVREPMPIQLNDLGRCDPKKKETDKKPVLVGEYLLLIRYAERCVEEVPVFADTDGCAPRKAANRVSEGVDFKLIRYEGTACWGPPAPVECPCPADLPPSIPESLKDVLAPLCESACEEAVPLALLSFTDGKLKPEIKVDGRRYLPGPLNPRQLTHICDVSWNHGDKTGREKLKADFEIATGPKKSVTHPGTGAIRLTVTFDRELHTDMVRVINDSGVRIFTLRFENHDGYWSSASRHAKVFLSACRTKLHCDLDACNPFLKDGNEITAFVTLACDFLKDKWGRAVDGNHLRGSLTHTYDAARKQWIPPGPSGDGVEGGTFESWFQMTGAWPAKESSNAK